jgi:hypothetical protein
VETVAADWHVDYQDTRPDINSSGKLVNVIDVHYVIDTDPAAGHSGVVTIAKDRYTADNVRALIDEEVARVKAVAAL